MDAAVAIDVGVDRVAGDGVVQGDQAADAAVGLEGPAFALVVDHVADEVDRPDLVARVELRIPAVEDAVAQITRVAGRTIGCDECVVGDALDVVVVDIYRAALGPVDVVRSQRHRPTWL